MKIKRIRICLERNWDEDGEEASENFIKLEGIERSDIVSIVHFDCGVYLYYTSSGDKRNGPDSPPAEVKQRPSSGDRDAEVVEN